MTGPAPHEPAYLIDERWDDVYVTCFACGLEWPCPTRQETQ